MKESDMKQTRKFQWKHVALGAAGLFLAGGLVLTPASALILPDTGVGAYVFADSDTSQNGWVKEGNDWYYYVLGKKKYTTYTIGGKLYYFNATTGALTTGFVTYAGYTYYFKPIVNDTPKNCYAVTGWQTINGKSYYFKDDYRAIISDWLTVGTYKYYFDENGERVTGWKEIDGKWYEFDSSAGYLVQGPLDSKPQGAGEDEQLSGWQQEGSVWYYYVDGVKQTAWQKISGKWYYFDAAGAMKTGWQKISGKWYYFNGGGAMQTGWKKISGKWYYFNGGGAMQTGWKKISGTYYYFKSGGAMAAKEYVGGYWLNADGSWTNTNKASWRKNATGWWYGDTSGWYAKNETLVIDGKSYTFNAAGYMQ